MIEQIDRVLCGETSPSEFLDFLEKGFPLLERLKDTPQDSEWHAEGCVRIHTEMVIAALLEALPNHGDLTELEKLTLVLGAALHDVGKVITTREQTIDGRVRTVSPRHAEVGRSYAAPRLAAFDEVNGEWFDWVLGIVGYHHHPRKLVSRNASPGRYHRIARSVPLHLLWIFERADINGRICSDAETQHEIVDLFRMGAEECGAWKSDPCGDWFERLEQDFDIKDPAQRDYVHRASLYLFDHNEILTLEEGVAKTWGQRSDFATLTIVCGASGSGKSTWIEASKASVVSLDEIRSEVSGRRDRQADNGKVMQLAKERLKEHLRAKQDVIWDATSLRKDGRSALVDLAHRYGCASEILSFAVSPKEMNRRNRGRNHAVPTKVIERQLDRLQWPEQWEAQKVAVIRP